jgi:hypothetical protein
MIPDAGATARRLLRPSLVLKQRPTWIRGLRLYEQDEDGIPTRRWAPGDVDARDRVPARSQFRSRLDPDRYALYWLQDSECSGPTLRHQSDDGVAPDDHTLVPVREFRRVPFQASGLGLLVFTAQPGYTAPVVAALAHFVERAMSVYQPSYLLLAHSLEEPRITVLLTGADQPAALQAGRSTGFSVDRLLPELRPMLERDPELYTYCPDLEHLEARVSPSAV